MKVIACLQVRQPQIPDEPNNNDPIDSATVQWSQSRWSRQVRHAPSGAARVWRFSRKQSTFHPLSAWPLPVDAILLLLAGQ